MFFLIVTNILNKKVHMCFFCGVLMHQGMSHLDMELILEEEKTPHFIQRLKTEQKYTI